VELRAGTGWQQRSTVGLPEKGGCASPARVAGFPDLRTVATLPTGLRACLVTLFRKLPGCVVSAHRLSIVTTAGPLARRWNSPCSPLVGCAVGRRRLPALATNRGPTAGKPASAAKNPCRRPSHTPQRARCMRHPPIAGFPKRRTQFAATTAKAHDEEERSSWLSVCSASITASALSRVFEQHFSAARRERGQGPRRSRGSS
jgi:hypothetical protein